MDVLRAIILGVVEGVTEFLPISSTGHLILASKLLGLNQDNFTKSFEIAIQLGAILAVCAIYYDRFFTSWEVLKRVIIAFIPTGVIGFLVYKIVKGYFLGNDLLVVATLFLGGVVLLFIDKVAAIFSSIDAIEKLSLVRVIIVGLLQSFAMVPGVSRSAITIIGGMLVGLDRKSACEFSFFLAVPTITVATLYDLYKSGSTFTSSNWLLLIVGFVSSFVTAFVTIKLFIAFVSKNSFFVFGVYRILISVAYYLLVL